MYVIKWEVKSPHEPTNYLKRIDKTYNEYCFNNEFWNSIWGNVNEAMFFASIDAVNKYITKSDGKRMWSDCPDKGVVEYFHPLNRQI